MGYFSRQVEENNRRKFIFKNSLNCKTKKEKIDFFDKYWDEIFKNNQWSHGKFTNLFEEKWSIYNNLNSVSFSSWSGAAEAIL